MRRRVHDERQPGRTVGNLPPGTHECFDGEPLGPTSAENGRGDGSGPQVEASAEEADEVLTDLLGRHLVGVEDAERLASGGESSATRRANGLRITNESSVHGGSGVEEGGEGGSHDE